MRFQFRQKGLRVFAIGMMQEAFPEEPSGAVQVQLSLSSLGQQHERFLVPVVQFQGMAPLLFGPKKFSEVQAGMGSIENEADLLRFQLRCAFQAIPGAMRILQMG